MVISHNNRYITNTNIMGYHHRYQLLYYNPKLLLWNGDDGVGKKY